MRHHFSLRASLAAIGMVVLFTAPAWAGRSVDWVKADPSDLSVGTPTVVTITSQVGLDATLIKPSVNLLEYAASGQLLATMPMYDDGTRGDVLPGDNIFTAQVTINQPSPTNFTFRVSVAYRGQLLRIQSSPLQINVVQVPTTAEVTTVLSTNQSISSQAGALIQQYGVDAARSLIVSYLSSLPTIAAAGISSDGQTIWYKYSDGLYGYYFANAPDTLGTSPSSNKALIFSPISTYSTVNTELVAVFNTLTQPGCCISPDPVVRDGAVTVDFMKTIYPYGVISIVTHGGVDANGNVIFQTGETASTVLGIPTSHLIDWALGRLAISADNFWLIAPSFITHYGGSFPGSVILFSTCHSLDNGTLSGALISKGAKTVFGWQNSVTVGFAGTTKEALFDQLVNLNKTTGDAYTAVPKVDTGIAPNARLLMAGANDVTLPSNLVTNGSFETGDFGGWTASASYGAVGYSAVVTGNSTDGTHAARLGRFDAIYAGGINGPPVPGAEPGGTDFMYQDVQLPASGSFTLTFSYNVQSYDSARYDWFDMLVQDATTGATLATVVNHGGNPSPNWGPYWNGGWQNVSYDLTAFAGRKVRLWFGDRQDGYGDQTATWIDNVTINCH